METPGERPPTRLRVVCQEGWDGARRHPQPAAGVQPAEQWCSSQSQPQPQLRYQHGSDTGHAALSSWPVANQNRRSRDFQQNQQLAAWQTNSEQSATATQRLPGRMAGRVPATATQWLYRHRLQPAAGPRLCARRLRRPATEPAAGPRSLQRPPAQQRPLAARRGRARTRGRALA